MKHLVKLKDMGKIYNMLLIYEYTIPYFSQETKKQKAAKVLFEKALRLFYILKPIVITRDKFID